MVAVAGLALVPLSCLSSSTGLLLMKSSSELEAALPLWRSWRWLLGFFCLAVVTSFLDLCVLSILPLCQVAPFAGLTIVVSCAELIEPIFRTHRTQAAMDSSFWRFF